MALLAICIARAASAGSPGRAGGKEAEVNARFCSMSLRHEDIAREQSREAIQAAGTLRLFSGQAW